MPSRALRSILVSGALLSAMTTPRLGVANPPPVTDVNRPVIIALVDFVDTKFGQTEAGATRDPAFYDKLFFGPGYPNVRDYFLEASGGKFTFSKARVVGPLRYREGGREIGREQALKDDVRFRGAVADLVRASISNLDGWDRDGDGVLSTTELGLVVVSAGGRSGAKRPIGIWNLTRGGGAPAFDRCYPFGNVASGRDPGPNEKWWCGDAAGLDEGAGFGTIAHEIIHMLGMGADLYGPWGSRYVFMNGNATIMHGTVGASDDRLSVLPDPYTRQWLGWSSPRTMSTSDPSACFWLDASHLAARTSGLTREPVRVRHPSRPLEAFYLDYRRRSDIAVAVGQPPISSYDKDVGGTGLLAWYAREKDGALDRVAVGIEKGRDELQRDLPLVGRQTAGTDDVTLDRDGDGVPDAVLWGPNFRFDSGPVRGTDMNLGANTMLATSLVPTIVNGRTTNVTTAFGSPQWITSGAGNVRLVGIDGFDFGVNVTVGRELGDRVAVRVDTGRPMAPNTDATCLEATNFQAPIAEFEVPDCVEVKSDGKGGWSPTKFSVGVKLSEPVREAASIVVQATSASPGPGPSRLEVGQKTAGWTFMTTGSPADPIRVTAQIGWPDRNFQPRRQNLSTIVFRGWDTPLVKGGVAMTCAARRALGGQLSAARIEPAMLGPIRFPPPKGSQSDVVGPVVMRQFTLPSVKTFVSPLPQVTPKFQPPEIKQPVKPYKY